jgi:hypothetical protein
MIKRVSIYVHTTKESNYDLIEKLGIDPESEAAGMLLYLGSEEKLHYDVDTETGIGKLIGANDEFFTKQ